MYTIGQVSNLFNIPSSTLRYYDKEGLIPTLQRKSGRRIFSDSDLEAIRVIECLKKSGLEIKKIKNFMNLAQQGDSTFEQRRTIFQQQRNSVIEEIEQLEKTLDMLNYKFWYYDESIKYGEEIVQSMIPESIPEPVKSAYLRAHSSYWVTYFLFSVE